MKKILLVFTQNKMAMPLFGGKTISELLHYEYDGPECIKRIFNTDYLFGISKDKENPNIVYIFDKNRFLQAEIMDIRLDNFDLFLLHDNIDLVAFKSFYENLSDNKVAAFVHSRTSPDIVKYIDSRPIIKLDGHHMDTDNYYGKLFVAIVKQHFFGKNEIGKVVESFFTDEDDRFIIQQKLRLLHQLFTKDYGKEQIQNLTEKILSFSVGSFEKQYLIRKLDFGLKLTDERDNRIFSDFIVEIRDSFGEEFRESRLNISNQNPKNFQ